MPSVPANGIRIEYESFGDRDAPAIVLIMGLGMQLVAWPEPFCEKLARGGFRVIRFDNRDIGLSTHFDVLPLPKNMVWQLIKARLGLAVRSGYTLDDMAADTVGLLDALGIERAHVVGASMGGMIAQQVAVRYPTRTRSLVSIMSSTGNRRLPAPSREVQKLFLGKPARPGEDASIVDYYVRFFSVLAGPGFVEDAQALRARVEQSIARSYHPAGSARQLLAVLAAGDRSAQLASVRAPTLVLHGDHDPLVPLAAGEDTARKIPGARLKIIPGMGHDMAAWRLLADEILTHARSVPQ